MSTVTVEEVRAWLNLTDTVDDVALQAGIDAAETNQSGRLYWPGVDNLRDVLPADLRQAIYLRTARYLSRRNSPDGLVGMADFGPARISRVDADIAALEGPYIALDGFA